MAEIVLKIDDSLNYDDGDILCAFRDDDIQICHAQELTNIKATPMNSWGLKDKNSVTAKVYDVVYQYRFERVNQYEVKRILLADDTFEIFGPTDIDVQYYIDRNLKTLKRRHTIFGETGAEIWYGGLTTLDPTSMWDVIELWTPYRKVNYDKWPLKDRELKAFLALPGEDFTKEEKATMLSPKLDPETGEVIAKRSTKINWEAVEDLAADKVKIKDKAVKVDKRQEREPYTKEDYKAAKVDK